MRRIIIKEGPLVFIRNVIAMEFFASIILYSLSFLENYEELYSHWGYAQYLRYDLFLILFFSLFELVYLIVLFLDWYFSHYEIHDKEIIRKTGLIFRRRKSVSLLDVSSVELYQSPISRMMHHGTIIIEHGNDRVTKLKNVGNFDEYIHIIKQSAHNASRNFKDYDTKTLIEQGESQYVEFKETFRYDARKGEASKELERMITKTIVGFMNAEGGTLLVGVNDSGKITGLENDCKSLPKQNLDGLENHLSMMIKTTIGLPFAKYVSVKFEKIEDKDVAVITVKESHKPAYLRNGDRSEKFFVRVGNSTQPFSMSDTQEYIKTHWK